MSTTKQDFVDVLTTQGAFFAQTAENAMDIMAGRATVSKGQLLRYVESVKQNSLKFCELNKAFIEKLQEEINGEKDQDRA